MIKERIIQVSDLKGIKKEDFFKKIGMTSANFRGEAKKTPLNSNAIENILSEFPDISAEWLLTGKGDIHIAATQKDFEIEIDIQILKYMQQSKYLSQKIIDINSILNDCLKVSDNEINDLVAKLFLMDISKSGRLYDDLKHWEKYDLDRKRKLHEKLEDYFEAIQNLFFDSFETLCKKVRENIQSHTPHLPN